MIALRDRQITSAWSNTLHLLTLLLALVACVFVLRLSDAALLYRGAAPAPAEPGPAVIAIGGETLGVPAPLLSYPLAAHAGVGDVIETGRIELALGWPDLGALAPGRGGIHLSITARHDPFGERERFERLFAPRFAAGAVAGPEGLNARQMMTGTGYGGEIVYYQAAAADKTGQGERFYYVRCGVPQADPVPLSCLRSLRLAPGLQASYRFDAALLGEWQRMERAVLGLIARMRGK